MGFLSFPIIMSIILKVNNINYFGNHSTYLILFLVLEWAWFDGNW